MAYQRSTKSKAGSKLPPGGVFPNFAQPPPTKSRASFLGDDKKSIATGGPDSPLQFGLLVLYHLARKPLLFPVYHRTLIYFTLVCIGGVLFDFFPPPLTPLANRNNVINLLLVRHGWMLTLSSLISFQVVTSYIYTLGQPQLMGWQTARLVIGLVFCQLAIGGFQSLSNVVGKCLPAAKFSQFYLNRATCRQADGRWLGFDVSVHIFMLILANLWIVEETAFLRNWQTLGRLLQSSDPSTSPANLVQGKASNAGDSSVASTSQSEGVSRPPALANLNALEITSCHQNYSRLSWSVKVAAITLAVLTLFHDIMIVTTVVYFHNMPSKLIAMLSAVSVWYFCFRVWFPASVPISPGLPGQAGRILFCF